jgi:hypothetical protein
MYLKFWDLSPSSLAELYQRFWKNMLFVFVSRASVHRAPLTLREKHRWKVFKNRVLKRIFGPGGGRLEETA